MDKFDTLIITLAVVLICAFVVIGPIGCVAHRQYRIEQAIKHGADPIAAKCAIEGDLGQSPMCIAYVATQGRKP